MKANFTPAVSEEIFAAWLDGNVTPDENAYMMGLCNSEPDLQEILDINDDVDSEYDNLIEDGYVLPEEFNEEFDLPYIEGTDDENAITMDDEILPYDSDEEIEEYEVEENTDEESEDVSYDAYPMGDDSMGHEASEEDIIAF